MKRGKVRLPVRRALRYEVLCSFYLIRVKPNICLSLGILCGIAATDSYGLRGDAERHRGLLRVQLKGCCGFLIELIVGRHAARCSAELQRFLPLFTQLSRTLGGLLRFHSASNVSLSKFLCVSMWSETRVASTHKETCCPNRDGYAVSDPIQSKWRHH